MSFGDCRPCFSLFLFHTLFQIPQSFTRTLYYYCFLILLSIFAIVLYLPLRLFLQSCNSKFLQFPHGRRLCRWCCPFLPSHTLGTSLREWHGSGLARRQRSEYLPESFRVDSSAWLTSPIATPKRASLNDGCRLWGLGGTQGKAYMHTTFCISRIVAGTTGQIQRVVCWLASPTRVRRKCRADDKHLSVPSDVHLLYGLAVPAFLCSSFRSVPLSMFFLIFIL